MILCLGKYIILLHGQVWCSLHSSLLWAGLLGLNPGGGDFSHPSRLALGFTQPPVQWALEKLGFGAGHLSPSSAKVKERVEL
jgi:hypothetical protein